MLAGTNDLVHYRLTTRDGPLGRLSDLSFDDTTWQVRHLIVDRDGQPPRRCLMHPLAIRRWDPGDKLIELTITQRQVERSPSLDCDRPPTLRETERYYRHFGWPPYWPSPGRGFVGAARPHQLDTASDAETTSGDPRDHCDPHLQSVRRLLGFRVHARDGRAGQVDDTSVDTATWAIRHLVIDTRSWWPDTQVLLSPEWTRQIDWPSRQVFIDLDREDVRRNPRRNHSPSFVPTLKHT